MLNKFRNLAQIEMKTPANFTPIFSIIAVATLEAAAINLEKKT